MNTSGYLNSILNRISELKGSAKHALKCGRLKAASNYLNRAQKLETHFKFICG